MIKNRELIAMTKNSSVHFEEQDLMYVQRQDDKDCALQKKTSLVRLKNEFLYADFDLTAHEQRLLFYFMSRFDAQPFFADYEVRKIIRDEENNKWNYTAINRLVLDRFYWTVGLRTLVLNASDVMKVVSGNSKTKSYVSLEAAVESLQTKMMKIQNEREDGTIIKQNISPLECSAFYEDMTEDVNISKSKNLPIAPNRKILFSFTQSFMQYVIAFSKYKNINLNEIAKIKNKYASRYFHWFLAQIDKDAALNKQSSSINITVDSLRERFLLGDKYARGFVKKIIEDPIAELEEKTDLKIKVKKVHAMNKRGKPLERVVFEISQK